MKKITWALLAIGTALACQYAQTLAAVIFLVTAICIIAVLWVRFYAAIIDDEAAEKAERMAQERFEEMVDSAEYRVTVRQYIVNGKGYEA